MAKLASSPDRQVQCTRYLPTPTSPPTDSGNSQTRRLRFQSHLPHTPSRVVEAERTPAIPQWRPPRPNSTPDPPPSAASVSNLAPPLFNLALFPTNQPRHPDDTPLPQSARRTSSLRRRRRTTTRRRSRRTCSSGTSRCGGRRGRRSSGASTTGGSCCRRRTRCGRRRSGS